MGMKPVQHKRAHWKGHAQGNGPARGRNEIHRRRARRWRLALLAWFATLAAIMAGVQPGGAQSAGKDIQADIRSDAASPLSEDAAARFIASLAPMRRLGHAIARRAALVETNLEDPLMPYAHLAPGQLAGEAALAPLLERYGFSDIGEWLAVGRPLMRAYYHVSGGGRDSEWARQLAEVLMNLQGAGQGDPDQRAAPTARLLEDLRARREAKLAKSDIEIARKFRRSLELATDGTIK